MTWPTDDLTNAYTDNSSDSPANARAEINAAILKLKSILAEVAPGANVYHSGAAVASIAANGFFTFPFGITIQWGTFTSTVDTDETFTFPAAFSSACYNVQITRKDEGITIPLAVKSFTASNFVVNRDTGISGSVDFMIIAIGS